MTKRKTTAADRQRRQRFERIQVLFDQLPFVPNAAERNGRCWALPATGEYAGGCHSGAAAAEAYIKYLRERYKSGLASDLGMLQHIVFDMTRTGDSNDSLRGQIVGFFCELDRYLMEAAKLATGLDRVTFEELSEGVRKGLARTAADDEDEIREERSRVAKAAWAKRKARIKRAA